MVMTAMNRANEWFYRNPVLVVLACMVAVAVPGFLRTEQIDRSQEDFIQCVASWGHEAALRAEALDSPSQARNDALDRLVRAAALGNQELFAQRLEEYVSASDALSAAIASNPVPESPTLQCNGEG